MTRTSSLFVALMTFTFVAASSGCGSTTTWNNDGGSGGGNPCKRSSDCDEALVCGAAGACVACRAPIDCPRPQVCRDGGCVDPITCSGDLDCADAKLVCDKDSKRCVECNGFGDCPLNKDPAKPQQACLEHACVKTIACMSSLDCAATNRVCVTAAGLGWPQAFLGKACAECGAASDCAKGSDCIGNLCVKACALAGAHCGKIGEAVCGECPNNAECTSSGTACLKQLGTATGAVNLAASSDWVYASSRDVSSRVVTIQRSTGQSKAVMVKGYTNGLVTTASSVVLCASGFVISAPLGEDLTQGTLVHDFMDVSGTCYELAADEANAYVHVNQRSPNWFGIYKVPLDGGSLTKLSNPNQLVQVAGMVPRGPTLYWHSFNEAQVNASDIASGRVTNLLRGEQFDDRIAVDDAYIYLSQDDKIVKLPVGGGDLQAVASGLGRSTAVIGLHEGKLVIRALDGVQSIDLATGKATQLLTAADGTFNLATLDEKGGLILSQGSTIIEYQTF